MKNDTMTADEADRWICCMFGSPAMQEVCDMAVSSPFATSTADAARVGLVATSQEMLQAIDAERIQFIDAEARAVVMGLLALVFEFATEGKFASDLVGCATEQRT